MPKSTASELKDLRLAVFERAGWRCQWPGCQTHTWVGGSPLQLVHLEHRGLGGRKSVNTPENCVTLCRFHHDIFDGRDGSSNTKRELAVMLRTVAAGR